MGSRTSMGGKQTLKKFSDKQIKQNHKLHNTHSWNYLFASSHPAPKLWCLSSGWGNNSSNNIIPHPGASSALTGLYWLPAGLEQRSADSKTHPCLLHSKGPGSVSRILIDVEADRRVPRQMTSGGDTATKFTGPEASTAGLQLRLIVDDYMVLEAQCPELVISQVSPCSPSL